MNVPAPGPTAGRRPAPPRALAIGGLDPSAGAGVLLDAFVMARLGYQPAVAITTVTAQNSAEFLGQWPVEPERLTAQLRALAAEGPIACVKTGALGSAENAAAIAEWLGDEGVPVLVCDPVLLSSSGGDLVTSTNAVDALARVVSAVTPNAQETLRLAGRAAGVPDAAASLAERWSTAVIATGLPGPSAEEAVDLIVTPDGAARSVAHPLVPGVGDVRGTGCMLASALACALADGNGLREALGVAHALMRDLLGEAKAIGRGRWQVDLATVVRGPLS